MIRLRSTLLLPHQTSIRSSIISSSSSSSSSWLLLPYAECNSDKLLFRFPRRCYYHILSNNNNNNRNNKLIMIKNCNNNLFQYNDHQIRTYWYLPTSWKELEIRWLRKFNEKRTVYVRLLKDSLQDPSLHHLHESTIDKTSVRIKNYWRERLKKRFQQGATITATTNATTAGLQQQQQQQQQENNDLRGFRARMMLQKSVAWWKVQQNKIKARKVASKLKWKLRSQKMNNRMIRYSRNYADRMQKRALYYYRRYLLRKYFFAKPITIPEYTEINWFCKRTGRPITSRDETGRFVNPWQSQSTAGIKTFSEIVRWKYERMNRYIHTLWNTTLSYIRHYINNTINNPATDGDNNYNTNNSNIDNNNNIMEPILNPVIDTYIPMKQLKCTWIGQSTCLLQQGPINILIDPIFSMRCSPFQSLVPIGMTRDVPAAISINELPNIIHVCLISHDHYDHLDYNSVIGLKSRVQLWIVPLGICQWLIEKCNIPKQHIIELEWWESVKLVQRRQSNDNNNYSNDCNDNNDTFKVMARHSAVEDFSPLHPALTDPDVMQTNYNNEDNDNYCMWITCCPAQHWASRTFFDRNYRLWCSYGIYLPNNIKVYYAGDTALPIHFPLFDQIRDYLGGNINLGLLPIGAYEPEFYMNDSHINPNEAVKIHQILDIQKSIAIHWGTFPLSEEPMYEPPIKLQQAATKANVDFTAIRIGDSITIESNNNDNNTIATTIANTEEESEINDDTDDEVNYQ